MLLALLVSFLCRSLWVGWVAGWLADTCRSVSFLLVIVAKTFRVMSDC